MLIEQAIDILRMSEQARWLCGINDRDVKKALDMAAWALEKQDAKKPVGNHYAHMRCPVCNHRIPSGGGSSSRRRDNWCNCCGQKIDWTKNQEGT